MSSVIKFEGGYEIHWISKEEYSSKIIVFEKAGVKTDMIFHTKGTKSWFINAGGFKVRWIDTSNGVLQEKELNEGDVWDILALTPHSLESVYPNSSITEVNNNISKDDKHVIISSQTFKQGEENV